MSNYHITNGSSNGNVFTVVFHVPVPNVNNEVGINYRTAMVEYGTVTSSVPFISGAEQTQIDNGELVEYHHRFTTNPSETLLQKRDRIDALYSIVIAKVQERWANYLSYWGYSRDVE